MNKKKKEKLAKIDELLLPVDHFTISCEMISRVVDEKIQKKLANALAMSAKVSKESRKSMPDTDKAWKNQSPRTIMDDWDLNDTMLTDYKIILSKKEAICFLKSKALSLKYSSFKEMASKKKYIKTFDEGVIKKKVKEKDAKRILEKLKGKHFYTYAEILILANHSCTLEIPESLTSLIQG